MDKKQIQLQVVKKPIIELLSAEQHGKIFLHKGKYFVEVYVCATITEISGKTDVAYKKYLIEDGTSCIDCYLEPRQTKLAPSGTQSTINENFQLGDTVFIWGKLRSHDNGRKIFVKEIKKCYKLADRTKYWKEILE
ncbi:uncharacterized protein LOC123004499 [Tribolium madens]|uniref:uncharacterized protein LOC123004499 n=1 Tax=Tribolium madens TaxID=41895 RepID=UPI001CF7447F|nr:uncharacterized protein LOC123004499 [Tribolium madens]